MKPHLRRQISGIALVLVITSLAMIALLVVAFLTMASTERRASNTYAEGVGVRVLSDTTANVVIGQIREATERLGAAKTWASQPGAIRTYGIDGEANGRAKLDHVFKLYSSDTMVVTGTFDPETELPPADWLTQPARYTDLNQPVAGGESLPGQPKFHFPILTPPATAEVQGFEIAAAPGATTQQPAPMPVKWLYQLKDGRLVAPTGGTGATLTFDPAVVTTQNPIVGRVAFWTDDESAKVNINTASEGTFWDQPVGNSKIERGVATDITQKPTGVGNLGYAASLPVRNEFTRYAGHPARTSLSAVLGTWLPITYPASASDYPTYLASLEQYHGLTPRVAFGGSQAGTVLSASATLNPTDSDRLYASVDELFFGTAINGDLATDTAKRAQNQTPLSADTLEKTRFFLTASSRAPEVNLFNKPRIALWPLSLNKTMRNAVDGVIAFASTTGRNSPTDGNNERAYYFQRSRVDNAGTGANSSAYPREDFANVPRNQQLYQYLQDLTGNAVPGFGKSFRSKYGTADCDQVLTEAMDYVRSQVNIFSAGLSPAYRYVNGGAMGGEWWNAPLVVEKSGSTTKGFGRFPTLTEAALVFAAAEKNAADTTVGNATKLQAFVLLQFYRPNPGLPHTGTSLRVKIENLDKFKVNGQSLGFPASGEIVIKGSNYMGGWGHSQAAVGLLLPLLTSETTARTQGTDPNTQYPFVSPVFTIPPVANQAAGVMSFTGADLKITISAGPNAQTDENTVQKLTLNFPDASEWPRPRKFDTNLDGKRLFNERLSTIATTTSVGAGAAAGAWASKMAAAVAHYRDYRQLLINSEDVVRSVQLNPDGPSRGDYRLLAATYDVPVDWFGPRMKYQRPEALKGEYTGTDWASRGAHSLREERWSLLGQPGYNPAGTTSTSEIANIDATQRFRPSSLATAGRLVKGLAYAPSCVPAVPSGLNGAFLGNLAESIPGDWENGTGIFQDGPYIRNPTYASSKVNYDNEGKYCSSLFTYGYYYPDDSSTGLNFTPNRQIASAVAFGALPTGVKSAKPWQTLLFSPNPAAGDKHPGFGSPRDHLFLDFFWMPVAEPYAISEPFSTAGKVNMNYDILPFRYIKRRTALLAVLKDARVTAIPAALARDQTSGKADNYKGLDTCPYDFRYLVNLDHTDGTLRGFEDRFKDGDIFRSASEICDISLVPKALPGATYLSTAMPTYSTMSTWWAGMTLTGDNARENPYNDLYPRLTTKSNVYRVHLRVQTLKKLPSSSPATWKEGVDQMTGEYRGSFLLERYIDANDRALPDYASTDFATETLDTHYRFRIVDRKQFAP
jgi:uncharacterized protein (TIGR02600 family)